MHVTLKRSKYRLRLFLVTMQIVCLSLSPLNFIFYFETVGRTNKQSHYRAQPIGKKQVFIVT